MIAWAGAERLAAGLTDGYDARRGRAGRWTKRRRRFAERGESMKIGVVGGGAWGTALAQVAAYGGRDTLLWAMEDAVVSAVNHTHENPVYLKGCKLDPAIKATTSFSELGGCDAWIVGVPARRLRAVLSRMPCPNMPLILCSKGIEEGSGKMLHEVAHKVCPSSPIAVLSGPSFAHEVADGLPTAVTLACEDDALAERLRQRLSSPAFRIYLSDDVVGAEVGGAGQERARHRLRHRRGTATGPERPRRAHRARLLEMTRFAIAQGARRETLAGLSGLGDLVLTCSSTSSRNFSLGLGSARANRLQTCWPIARTVAEGAFTAPVLARLARDKGIDMPIVAAVDALIGGRANVEQVLEQLLARPPRAESHEHRTIKNRSRCPSFPSRRSASGRASFPPRQAARQARPFQGSGTGGDLLR